MGLDSLRYRPDPVVRPTHTCTSCGWTEPCAKKYVHVCGKCGHRWRTGTPPRELKAARAETRRAEQARMWGSSVVVDGK